MSLNTGQREEVCLSLYPLCFLGIHTKCWTLLMLPLEDFQGSMWHRQTSTCDSLQNHKQADVVSFSQATQWPSIQNLAALWRQCFLYFNLLRFSRLLANHSGVGSEFNHILNEYNLIKWKMLSFKWGLICNLTLEFFSYASSTQECSISKDKIKG